MEPIGPAGPATVAGGVAAGTDETGKAAQGVKAAADAVLCSQ